MFIRGGKDVTSTWKERTCLEAQVFGTEDATGTTRPGRVLYTYIHNGRPVGRSTPASNRSDDFPASESIPFSFAFLSPGRGAQQAWNPANFLPFAPSLLSLSLPHVSFLPSLFPYPFSRPRNNNRREKEIKGALSTLFPSLA